MRLLNKRFFMHCYTEEKSKALKNILYLTVLIQIASVSHTAEANPLTKIGAVDLPVKTHRLAYEIFADGEYIGNSTQKVFSTEQRYIITESTELTLSGWWGNTRVNSLFIEAFDKEYKLIYSNHKILEGTTHHYLTTSCNTSTCLATYQKTKKATNEEKRALSMIEELITHSEHVNPETILGLSKTIFSDPSNKADIGHLPKNSFDTTFANLPFYLQKHAKDGPDIEVTLFDTEKLKHSILNIRVFGWECLQLQGTQIKTRHFSLTDEKGTETHIWLDSFPISTDNHLTPHSHRQPDASSTKIPAATIPYIVRLTTNEKEGAIEIVLKEKKTLAP